MDFDATKSLPQLIVSNYRGLNRRNTMSNFLENAPSKTGGPSGGGRGNNPPKK